VVSCWINVFGVWLLFLVALSLARFVAVGLLVVHATIAVYAASTGAKLTAAARSGPHGATGDRRVLSLPRRSIIGSGHRTMEPKVSADDLAAPLSDVLDRVTESGERVVVERGSQPASALTPADRSPTITWEEFIALVGDLEMPDDGFADDLEEIQTSQGVAAMPEWPD